jgi:hypothetical protein
MQFYLIKYALHFTVDPRLPSIHDILDTIS